MLKYLRIIVFLVILLLPVLCNLIEHASSTILAVLVLIAVFAWLTRKKAPGFSPTERIIMWAFAQYFFVCLFFYLANGIFVKNASFHWNLDHEIRFLAFGVIYFLFHRIGLKAWTIWYGSAMAAIFCGLFSIYYISGIYASAGTSAIHNAMAFIESLRVSGAYTPITFGQLSLTFGCMGFAGIRYFHKAHPALVIVPVLALVGGILAAFLSSTRGAIIAIPFITVIFFIQIGSFRFPWRKRFALILSIILLSAGLYFMPTSTVGQRFQAGFSQAKAFLNDKGTGCYAVRLAMWSEACKMIKTHPFRGIGKNGYHTIITEKAAKNEVPKKIERFNSPHNNYLTNMTAYGIIGLLSLLAVFLAPLFILIPAARGAYPRNDMAFTGIILVGSFMVFALTETIFYRNINVNIYIILTAAILYLTTSNE